ncbi:MAG: hypothetical protein AMXMBFR80_21830 [Dehalococcoidia bacterium]
MPVLTRVRDVCARLATATARQVRLARRKMERRRLDSKLRSEMAALGEGLYGALESGELQVDLPAIPGRVTEIARLRSKIDALGRTEEINARVRESIADTDYNATAEASAEQAAGDAADRGAGSPAEQGGEG